MLFFDDKFLIQFRLLILRAYREYKNMAKPRPPYILFSNNEEQTKNIYKMMKIIPTDRRQVVCV